MERGLGRRSARDRGANGCRARSFFANRPGGGLEGYFPTQLSLPIRSFLDVYPGGVLPQVPVVVVCGPGGTPRPIATPTSTPTPTATPAANQAPTISDFDVSVDYLLVTVTATVTDEDGEVTTVHVAWGDNRSTLVGAGPLLANPSLPHSYPDEGSYNVRLTATDDDGAETVEERVVNVVAKVVQVRVDGSTLSSTNNCDNFSSDNEFSGSVTLSGATSELMNFSITTVQAANRALSPTFSQDLSVPSLGSGTFTVSASLIEIDSGFEGANDNLGSFSRSLNADVSSSFDQEYSQNLNGDGCSAIIKYRVRMDIQP